MKYCFKNSFDKSIKNLPPKQKEKIKKTCVEIIDVLEGRRELRKGLRFKHLCEDIYEISGGMKLRIIFSWKRDSITFILAGSHDEIKKFLKENV